MLARLPEVFPARPGGCLAEGSGQMEPNDLHWAPRKRGLTRLLLNSFEVQQGFRLSLTPICSSANIPPSHPLLIVCPRPQKKSNATIPHADMRYSSRLYGIGKVTCLISIGSYSTA